MSKDIKFLKLNLKDIKSLILSDIRKKNGVSYFLINSYSISLTNKLPQYRKILEANSRNLIDSKILRVILNGVKRDKNYYQIRGIDLTREILKSINEEVSIYILGGTVENLDEVVNIIHSHYPRVNIAEVYSPPFEDYRKMNIEEILVRIKKSKAKLVFVGLGTPKQDLISFEIAKRLDKTVISIGAALDFLTNRIPECPKWIQLCGFEWLYRLYKEPRRLWKRYLIDSPKLLLMLVKKRF